VYSTFLGGAGEDAIKGLAIDAAGIAYVTGSTSSDNFPVVAGAYQATRRGGLDAFVSKLNPAGNALVSSTYLGGAVDDSGNAIAVDASGRMYIAGDTYSTDFPRVNGQFKSLNSTAYNVGFITVLTADGASVSASGYFGGRSCLGPAGGSCSPSNPTDAATAIAVDPGGTSIYLAGYFSSIEVPVLSDTIQYYRNGRYDAFVAKMNASNLGIVYSTRLGGDGDERATGLGIDPQGNAYIVGSGTTTTFPTTAGALRVANAGQEDVFVAKLSTLGIPVALSGGCSGGSAVLRAVVASNATGSVAFMEGGATVATIPISNGVAQYSGPAAVGVHKYMAVKSSDGAMSLPVYCKVNQ